MDQRTIQQNKAMHKFFELLSEALNDAGLDMKKTLREDWEIPWTPENVKNHIWRPVQEALLDKESTTELDTTDPGDIYSVINRHMGEKHGIHVPWPSNR